MGLSSRHTKGLEHWLRCCRQRASPWNRPMQADRRRCESWPPKFQRNWFTPKFIKIWFASAFGDCQQNGNNLNIYESRDDDPVISRRRCDFSTSFDNYSCSCCKETSPTQSVMLGARLDAARRLQNTTGLMLRLLRNYVTNDATKYAVNKLTLTKRSSLLFMKFRLCRPSVHTGDIV